MEVALQRLILALFIGALSFGMSQIIPGGVAYGEEDDGSGQIAQDEDESNADNEEAGGENESKEADNLSVHLKVDSSKVNPIVRERYNIYAKVDPENPKSKKFLFKLEKGDETEGDVDFANVKEGKHLQLFVVKDNYQRDCEPEEKELRAKMGKDSTIKSMPSSVSIKLVQGDKYLKESNMKKFSGYDAVPSCVITEIAEKEGEE